MPIQNTNMFKTQSPYEQQIEEMKRRQQMAEMLQQQALQPLESQVAPGGMVVPTSPVLGLTKMLQAYMGGKQLRDIEKQRGETEKGARSEALDYLRSFNPEQKTIGMGEAAVNQLPMPQVGNNGQVSYQAPSVTAMPNARPVASLDQPMQMQVGGPLNRQDQMRRSEEGIFSDNPLVRALAQTKYEAASKPINFMDYMDKPKIETATPESRKAYLASIQAGTPDASLLNFPTAPKSVNTTTVMQNGRPVVIDANTGRLIGEAPPHAAGVTVNLDTKGNELSQKLYLEKIDKLSGPATNAARIDAKLAEMEDATKRGTFTGAMAPNATGAAQFMSSFGINVKPEELANTRTFEAASNQLVLDFMAANGGARGFTENETKMLRDAFPKIIDSPAARAQIAQLLRNRGKQDVRDYNDAVKTYKTTYPKSLIPYNPIESRSNWNK
jgi:hypothetical protein